MGKISKLEIRCVKKCVILGGHRNNPTKKVISTLLFQKTSLDCLKKQTHLKVKLQSNPNGSLWKKYEATKQTESRIRCDRLCSIT